METLFGFVAGYLAGCKDGQDGVNRLRASVEAIMKSDEAKRLTAEALSFAGVAVRRAASGRSLSATVGTVTDMLVNRASAAGNGTRAARGRGARRGLAGQVSRGGMARDPRSAA